MAFNVQKNKFLILCRAQYNCYQMRLRRKKGRNKRVFLVIIIIIKPLSALNVKYTGK